MQLIISCAPPLKDSLKKLSAIKRIAAIRSQVLVGLYNSNKHYSYSSFHIDAIRVILWFGNSAEIHRLFSNDPILHIYHQNNQNQPTIHQAIENSQKSQYMLFSQFLSKNVFEGFRAILKASSHDPIFRANYTQTQKGLVTRINISMS